MSHNDSAAKNQTYNIPTTIDCAFYSCDELTSVSIPDTVKSIGNKAFALCTQLISVKFEGKIEEWHKIAKGEDCFSGSPVNTVICCDGETPI